MAKTKKNKNEDVKENIVEEVKKVFLKIVIPNYNNGDEIKRCLDSILCQTFQDYFVIIVDDVSTDESYGYCKEYEAKYPDKIKCLRLEKKGFAGGAKNFAIDYNGVDSVYTWFVDSDDNLSDEKCLKDFYEFSKDLKYDLIFHDVVLHDTFSGKNFVRKFTGINDVVVEGWSRITRSSNVVKFIPNIINDEDVIPQCLQIDSCNSIGVFNRIMYVHNYQNERPRTSLLSCIHELPFIKDKLDNYVFKKAECYDYCKRFYNKRKNWFLDAIDKSLKITGRIEKDAKNPVTIQDKIRWIGTFGTTHLKIFCADKISLHDYCKQKLGVDLCTPILKIYKSPDDIKFSELPESFVMKCNHGSGYNQKVINRNVSEQFVKNKMKDFLSKDFSEVMGELQYHDIVRKCYAEKLMIDDNQRNSLFDYKFFCINGVPEFFYINSGDGHGPVINYYDMDFNPLKYSKSSNFSVKFDKPKNFEMMKEYAKKLSEDFDLVRVDFYEVNGKVFLGELTFTPGAGDYFYVNNDIDIMLGEKLKCDESLYEDFYNNIKYESEKPYITEGAKIAVVAMSDSKLEYQYRNTNKVNKEYCKKNGYDYIFEKIPDDLNVAPTHMKRELIKTNLEKYDWVMYLDVDAWFNNFDIRIEDIIEKYAKGDTCFIVARHHNGMSGVKSWYSDFINAGVLLFKNCEKTYDILDKWQNIPEAGRQWCKSMTTLHDQPLLSCLLMFDHTIADSTVIVEDKVMNYFTNRIPIYSGDEFILHASGVNLNRSYLNGMYEALKYTVNRNKLKIDIDEKHNIDSVGKNSNGVNLAVQEKISEIINNRFKKNKKAVNPIIEKLNNFDFSKVK